MTKEKTFEEFLDALGSKAPTPGGGGAAGISGAFGAALCEMVCSLTIGKKKYQGVEEEMKKAAEKARECREVFLSLADEDEEVFLPLSKAYALKKDTDEEKEIRNRVMEEALNKAVSVPFKVLEACHKLLDTLKFVAENGSVLAVSDASCSASMTRSALESASCNVLINTRSMKNRKIAEEMNKRNEELLSSGIEKAEEIIRIVRGRLTK